MGRHIGPENVALRREWKRAVDGPCVFGFSELGELRTREKFHGTTGRISRSRRAERRQRLDDDGGPRHFAPTRPDHGSMFPDRRDERCLCSLQYRHVAASASGHCSPGSPRIAIQARDTCLPQLRGSIATESHRDFRRVPGRPVNIRFASKRTKRPDEIETRERRQGERCCDESPVVGPPRNGNSTQRGLDVPPKSRAEALGGSVVSTMRLKRPEDECRTPVMKWADGFAFSAPSLDGKDDGAVALNLRRQPCRGSVGPISTILPRYITAVRSETWRTTERSCAMKR